MNRPTSARPAVFVSANAKEVAYTVELEPGYSLVTNRQATSQVSNLYRDQYFTFPINRGAL